MSYKTNERLSSVKITNDDILKTIANLDPNKAHGHDKIGVYDQDGTSIFKPLRLIFNHYIDDGIYPCKWKKANVVTIHKKCENGFKGFKGLKNYRPVCLLPICSKIFERLFYN